MLYFIRQAHRALAERKEDMSASVAYGDAGYGFGDVPIAVLGGLVDPATRPSTLDYVPEQGDRVAARRAARYLAGASLSETMHRERQAVLSAARERETARRAALALATQENAPESDTAPPVGKALSRRVSDAADVDEYRGMSLRGLTYLASERWPVARRIVRRFEHRLAVLDAERRDWVALAQAEPSNDGRGTVASYRTADEGRTAPRTNGTEVRGSERWTPSRRRMIRYPDGTRPDWRVFASVNGVRVVWTPPERESGSTASLSPERQAADAERRATDARIAAIVARQTSNAHDYNAG